MERLKRLEVVMDLEAEAKENLQARWTATSPPAGGAPPFHQPAELDLESDLVVLGSDMMVLEPDLMVSHL